MTDDSHSAAGDSPIRRADAALDQAGERIGALAALARNRLQELAAQGAQAAQQSARQAAQRAAQAQARARTLAQEQAQHMAHNQDANAQPDGAPPGEGAEEGSRAAPDAMSPAMQRADVLVDEAAQRLSVWGASAGKRMRIMLARLREEGDDIWAEAQSIRRQDTQVNQDTSDSPQP